MACSEDVIRAIDAGAYDTALAKLYGEGRTVRQRTRYRTAVQKFTETFGAGREVSLYSTPGRTELGGNHTDHNNGCVMAAAINLDILAVVAKNSDGVARVCSHGFVGMDEVDSRSLLPNTREFGHSAGMVRGVLAGLQKRGGVVGGFDAYTTSDVLKGSGLSSSAAFEVCIGQIVNGEYNVNRFSATELGIIGQYAENVFFGKPSGLMDQLACATGGAVAIDFADADNPVVRTIPFDLAAYGCQLVITDTKGNHADLTGEYAAIRAEMEAVAACFGKKVLREVPPETFYAKLAGVRAQTGDRAVLRAIHYYAENRRVEQLAAALEGYDFDAFRRLVVESGHSSFEYNQNAYAPGDSRQQEIPLALALSQQVLQGEGAWRLQGGGFAGTIQAFVPQTKLEEYKNLLGSVFGDEACHVLTVRGVGSTAVVPDRN